MRRPSLSACLVTVVIPVVLGPGSVLAWGPKATTYEVAEIGSIQGKHKLHREATATLVGAVEAGADICPTTYTLTSCNLVVAASDDILLSTGVGPAKGLFWVVGQLDNPTDGPEQILVEGFLRGEIDLSMASIGLGSITGKWEAKGVKGLDLESVKAKGTFTGTFYLPFVSPSLGCNNPCYLIGGVPTPVQPDEFSIGFPAVRLDIVFSN